MKRLWTSVAAAGVLWFSPAACADGYPDRAVKVVIGFSAGSGPDVIGRAITSQLSQDLGQPFMVQNLAGANGLIAIKSVVGASPDGYSLLYSSSSIAPVPYMYRNPSFDLTKDLAPIATAGILDGDFVLVQPSLPVANIREFIDYARSHRILYGSPGIGNGLHLATELFNEKAGLKMEHVPYRGASEVTSALLGGSIQVMFVTPPSVFPMVKSGMLKAIGYTGSKPFAELPDLPLVKDTLPSYPVQGSWGMFFAPKGTPNDVIDKLNAAIQAALKQPAVANVVQKSGYDPDGRSPEETAQFFKKEIEAMAEAVKAAKIQPE